MKCGAVVERLIVHRNFADRIGPIFGAFSQTDEICDRVRRLLAEKSLQVMRPMLVSKTAVGPVGSIGIAFAWMAGASGSSESGLAVAGCCCAKAMLEASRPKESA